MKWKRLDIVGYYYRVYIFETTEELQVYCREKGWRSDEMQGGCYKVFGQEFLMGDIYLSFDGSLSTTVHELYHAVHHIYKQHKESIGIARNGKHIKTELREEIFAYMMGDAMEGITKIILEHGQNPNQK